MKVYSVFVIFILVAACCAAPGKTEEDGKIELFSGVAIEKDATGEDRLNVKFEPGELREAARTFEEARGKIKKYTPLLAGLGVKVVAVLGILFGGLTLLVTKALVVAKIALLAAAALGVQKLLSGGGLNTLSGKVASIPMIQDYQTQDNFMKISNWQSQSPQWNAPTAAAGNYPYARSSNIAQDANDLAYKSQIPS